MVIAYIYCTSTVVAKKERLAHVYKTSHPIHLVDEIFIWEGHCLVSINMRDKDLNTYYLLP